MMKIRGSFKSIALMCAITGALLAGCSGHAAPEESRGQVATPPSAPSTQTTAASGTSATSAPQIVDYGPRDIEAGIAFNKQPNGQAAVWVRLSESLEGTDAVVMIDGKPMQSSINQAQITALVPEAVYATTGDLSLSVVQHKNGTELRSGPVKMVVH